MIKKGTASDIMTAPVITARADMPLTEVIKLMALHGISGVPVVDNDGRLIGMITGRTVMNLENIGEAAHISIAEVLNMTVKGEVAITRVSEFMTKQLEIYVPTCQLDTPIEEVINIFAARRVNRIIVTKDDKVTGIICRYQIICEMDRIYSQFVMHKK